MSLRQRLSEVARSQEGWSGDEEAGPSGMQRQLLVLSTLMMASLSILWGGVYFVFGERPAAFIPWTYMAISFANLAVLRRPAHYRLLRSSQLLFSLLLPFLLMWSLGGMVNSSAVVLWSFTCPMGALVFAGRRQALYWFLAFVGLVVLSGFVNYPDVEPTNDLPILVVVSLFVLNLTGVSFVAFFLIRFFVVQSGRAYDLLGREREKTENLVRNMLPATIAEQLKQRAGPIADRIDGVAIVFVDIVGFTPLAMVRPPEEVVTLLDEVFSEFDVLAAELGLEKIKTIGDAYMVCGGLAGDPDGIVSAAQFALNAPVALHRAGRHEDLQVTLGMHCGTVVAGVIGRAKFSYDVWGDAVNVAARLQQNGTPGRVLVSDAVRQALGDRFRYEPRGLAELKGHAPVETFFLLAK